MADQEESCSILDQVAEGTDHGLDHLDHLDQLSAVAYLLALTIKNLGAGAPDYTDICALAKSLQPYDSLPDYKRNAARLHAWEEISENTTSQEVDWSAVLAAIQCARCCNITKNSLENSVTFLLCTISKLIQPV